MTDRAAPISGSTPDPDPIATAVVKALAYQREGLVAALTAILLHGEDDLYPCHAVCDADCIDTMRNLAACALAAVDRSPDA